MAKRTKKTSIGGQALIEGIMMRGPFKTAMAVRQPDGNIHLETWENGSKKWYSGIPFVRGIFNLIDTLKIGYDTLMKSADIAGQEEEPTKFEKWLAKTFHADLMKIVEVVAVIMALGLSFVLFVFLPSAVSSLFKVFISSNWVLTLIEGVVKVLVFLLYLFLCTRMKDVQRVFQYHGAEHKTIACYEAGEELTPENIRKYPRFHPRCGTSFIFLVLIISIIVCSVVTWDTLIKRMLIKLLMLPVIVGIAYELIKLAGRYDNIFTRMISAPGLWLQNLTTFEPDGDDVLECAIAAMKEVIPDDEHDDEW